MNFKKKLVFIIVLLFSSTNVFATPDLIENVKQVTYEMMDGRLLTMKLDKDANLVDLFYGKKKLSHLPSDIISKIFNVDVYSISIDSSLGVKGTDSWLSIDEKYVYFKFYEYRSDSKVLEGEYEIKITFLNCNFKKAIIKDLKSDHLIDEFDEVPSTRPNKP